ncbi:enoyl-CoA hydratase/isomerase family protein [Zhengella sp. ZM62]|uniref:enoyl-CoA hydratase/isomerase family protein n=1 Tax=Zhengella sedimenti TaxID=3390035 RepID=UPI0039756590
MIGFARAKEYVVAGDPIGAKDIARIGLHTVPNEDFDHRVAEFVDRIAARVTRTVSWSKVSVNIALRQIAHSVLDASLSYEALSSALPQHGEAIAAFREKRGPDFVGR